MDEIVKFKISYIYTQLFAIVTFYCIMNITYLTQILHINSTITLAARLSISFAIFVVIFVKRKKAPSSIYKLLCLWWGVIFISSIINHDDLIYFISLQSRTVLVCTLLEYYHVSRKRFIAFLSTWQIILLLLCVLDIATIILFPDGLYTGDQYTEVWLLGYKTARLVYNIPLAILTCYLSLKKYNKIRVWDLAIVFLCAISSLMVEATGASIAILLFVVIVYLTTAWGKKPFFKAFLKKLFDYKVVAAVYAVITALTVLGSSLIIYISENFLGKSATLSHRTEIWERCLEFIAQKPILGMGYLTTDQYSQTVTLIRLGTNAHNMVLSILITAGVIGMIVYFSMFCYSWKSIGKKMKQINIVLIAGSLTYLLVGLSSSALIFSPFAFVTWMLMCYEKVPDKKKKEVV